MLAPGMAAVSRRKPRAWLASVAALACALAIPAAAHAGDVSATNSSPITIRDDNTAGTYPSTLKVQGGDGSITSVKPFVKLSHNFPDDIDIALVSPTGQASVVMSDACGGVGFTDRTFIFSTAAAAPLSDDGTPPSA